MRQVASDYRARGLLKNPHLQSILSSSPWRRRAGMLRMQALAVQGNPHILDLPDGTRLAGVHYAAPAPGARTMVLLLHGWEGSAQSSYILHSAAELLAAGIDVFALNFRDHGDTHHLNEGLFHSCRLQEVVDAAKAVVLHYRPVQLLVAGYSLGGNFSLRLALAARQQGLPLAAAFAICPPVDPSHVLRQLEQGPPLYHWYFMRKWRGSLKRKRELFPEAHAISDEVLKRDMRGLTQWLVNAHTDWQDEEQYFAGYAVSGQRLTDVGIPVRLLVAADDPVIPIQSLRALQLPPSARMEIAETGGHCGFIEDWRGHGYAERWLKNAVIEVLNALQ